MSDTITAAEARANAAAATYGADEVVKSVSRSIAANSRIGATSIVEMLNPEAVSEPELDAAIARLQERGFTVKRVGHTLTVSW